MTGIVRRAIRTSVSKAWKRVRSDVPKLGKNGDALRSAFLNAPAATPILGLVSPGYGILSRRSARAARWIGSLLCLWPAWSAPSAAAAEAVGWRTDGSGEYLDADPPVRWSVAENVVWKTPLPSWSNATPVRVGERIFICSEPNVLLCLNAATGEIQWRRASDYLDAMAPDEAGRMRELAARMDIAGAQRQLRNLRGKIGRLDAELRQKTAVGVFDQ